MKYVFKSHFSSGVVHEIIFDTIKEVMEYLEWSLDADRINHPTSADQWYYTIETIIEK